MSEEDKQRLNKYQKKKQKSQHKKISFFLNIV